MSLDLLTNRALGRATLARQLLLERVAMSPLEVVSDLVGLQAQNPRDPYLALWSRVRDFDPVSVADLIEGRALVRIVVMRGTIHLVTADDALSLRPVTQPVLTAELARHPLYAPALAGVDVDAVMTVAEELLAQPMTGPQLRAVLAERFPGVDAAAMGYACRCLLPLVQVPPRGVWGKTGQVTVAELQAWVGKPLRPAGIDAMVLRYLRAFGPATAADVSTWSRLTGMAEVLARLRPQLQPFVDERGRELLDIPDAPRPDSETPAPPRFLPEYDNVLLSHADRSRFAAGGQGRVAAAVGPYKGAVLVDGQVQGIWHCETDKATKTATIVVEHLPLPRAGAQEVEAEADRVVRFWVDADDHDVRMTALE